MTPSDLKTRGLRVSRLAWLPVPDDYGYVLADSLGGMYFVKYDDGAAIAAANADHIARICAAIEPIAPRKASFADFTEANDVGDEILLHGQPGKRSAIAPPDVAQAARVLLADGNSIMRIADTLDNAMPAATVIQVVEALRAMADGGAE